MDCKGKRVDRFRVYTLKEHLVWDMPVKNNLIHGPATLHTCIREDCRKLATVMYKGGVLEGNAVIERVPGSTASARFRDGVLDGPFTLTTPAGTYKGRFEDGILAEMSGPPGSADVRKELVRYLVPASREHFDLYRELSDYDFWKKTEGDKSYDRRGMKSRDVVGSFKRLYNGGFRTQDEPVSGNGIRTAYEHGEPKSFTRLEKSKPVALATADDPDNWKKPPEPYRAGFRPNKLLAVLGAGYGTPGVASFDLTLMAARFQDVGGGGYGLMYGLHRFSEPYHSVNAVMGGAAMIFTFYAGMGVRTDMNVTVPEVSLGFGLIGPMVYLRLAPPGKLGRPVEAGLTVKLPLGI